jgi:hypothetical protein
VSGQEFITDDRKSVEFCFLSFYPIKKIFIIIHVKSECDIDRLINDSKILERRKNMPNFQEIYKDAYKRLLSIINPRNHDLINIFRLEDEEDSQDIELAILRALLNCKLMFDHLFI